MKIQVLDHGYVEFVEAWGTGKSGTGLDPAAKEIWPDEGSEQPDHEVGIIEAARQSTQGSFRGWDAAACDCSYKRRIKEAQQSDYTGAALLERKAGHDEYCASIKSPGDARLLSYLYRNHHSTPFEFAGMVIEVQAPIFVFREWHRHRTQSYNEASARYAPLPDLNYIPSDERLRWYLTPGARLINKQAQGTGAELTDEGIRHYRLSLADHYSAAESRYQSMLNDGIPKELARLVLPVGRYSKMRASTNLRNWLAFMTLRCAPAAQWEMRQYANAVAKIIEEKFPQTYALWAEEREE